MNECIDNRDLVSVVIPSYNRKKTIKRCIDSVIRQSYPAFEIIVVDDGSMDGTVELLERAYGNALTIVKQEHQGAQAARNLGIMTATGEFIAFLDSDDCLTQTSFEDRLSVFEERPDVDMVYGDVAAVQQIVKFEKIQDHVSRKYLLEELSLCPFSVIMVRRQVFDNMPLLDTGYKSWQDDDLIMSLEFHNHKMYHCGKVVAKMFPSTGQISTNYENLYQGCNKIVNKYKGEIADEVSKSRLMLWKLRILRDWIQKEGARQNSYVGKTVCQAGFWCTDKICRKYFRHISG